MPVTQCAGDMSWPLLVDKKALAKAAHVADRIATVDLGKSFLPSLTVNWLMLTGSSSVRLLFCMQCWIQQEDVG